MYESLIEITLWFIFVQRNCKVTRLKRNFLKWTLLLILFNVQLNASILSAFVVSDHQNASSIDPLLNESQKKNINSFNSSSISISNDTQQTKHQQELPMVQSLFRHSFFVSSIYVVAYSVVFIIGLVGNCMVMIVVARASRMRNATNFL